MRADVGDGVDVALDRPADPTPQGRGRRWRWGLGIAAALVVLLLVPFAWVQAVGQAHLRTLETVEETPVALVLGAGLRPDGSPSTYLRRRLDAARVLYDAGTVQAVLVSGDSGSVGHDEPTAMRDYLVENGVPTQDVVLDYAGFDTHDSCVRAHDVFGVDRAVVLTQDYHVRRAVFSCVAAGIDTQGVGVSSASVRPRQAVEWRLRELPASSKAWWDGLTHADPAYGGPGETGVRDALLAP
ncbi:SanA/YdcF family protein [Cellulomonas fulva]|uniref:SanA/YdcF family protein n=1 Tax=Cellulomonas fulva TaxID=2835530 RepID=UPI0027DC6AD6|nr:ElyC/SanA/YdcF family protein [Cellulomonas fulva]